MTQAPEFPHDRLRDEVRLLVRNARSTGFVSFVLR